MVFYSQISWSADEFHVDELKNKQWVTITAKAYVEKRAEYSGENGVVLRATHITSAEKPEEELVYF